MRCGFIYENIFIVIICSFIIETNSIYRYIYICDIYIFTSNLWLTRRDRVAHDISVYELALIGADNSLSPVGRWSHYLNSTTLSFIEPFGDKLQWNFNGSTIIIAQENAFENAFCKTISLGFSVLIFSHINLCCMELVLIWCVIVLLRFQDYTFLDISSLNNGLCLRKFYIQSVAVDFQ